MEDKLFSLWPVNILHRVYSNHEQDKNNLLKFIQDYKKENPEGRSGSENSNLYESKYDLIKYIENNETLKKLVLFIGQGFKDIAYLTNKEAWEAKNINPSNISTHVKAMWFIDYKERGFESFLHNLEMLKKIKINKMVSSAIYSNNKEKDMAVIVTFEKIKS